MKYTIDESIQYQKNKIKFHEERLARATTENERTYSQAKLEYARQRLNYWLALKGDKKDE